MEGTQFGKYRLIELLGRGGMGEVWRAHDTLIDRIVAIKILSADISRDTLFQQRFRREAHATARLRSPHVIPIHDHGEIDGRLFVDMRLIEGDDLQSLLNRGPLEPQRAVQIIEQIAKALNATHAVGLLHRDVKPSNILLDDDDFAYLIDFGIARAADELSLTAAGDVIGTCHYMAPERFGNEAHLIDARSDIYSLACVLYECLTARHPFPGDSLEQQITNHLVTPPPRPSLANPYVPAEFDAVIAHGMAKNPDERYSSALDLARAAREAAGMGPPTGPQTTSQTGPQPGVYYTPPTGVPIAPTGPYPPSPPRAMPAPSRPWWRRKAVVIPTALLAVVAIVAGVGVTMMGRDTQTTNANQSALPFTGLREPQGISVDASGTVYVADTMHNRVLALQQGATKPDELPFTDLSFPTGVTADISGTVYVTDAGNKRVLMLPPGSDSPKLLEFSNLDSPTGVTVDSSRTVYITDKGTNKVWAMHAGSTQQYEVELGGLNKPTGVVVTGSGTIYVADGGNNKVLRFDQAASTPTELPFSGLHEPGGVTLDSQGAVYVTDSANNRVLKLPAGSDKQVVLPFSGLDHPWGLAVSNQGTVYVAGANNEILALQQNPN